MSKCIQLTENICVDWVKPGTFFYLNINHQTNSN